MFDLNAEQSERMRRLFATSDEFRYSGAGNGEGAYLSHGQRETLIDRKPSMKLSALFQILVLLLFALSNAKERQTMVRAGWRRFVRESKH